MSNIRKWGMWEWPLFNAFDNSRSDDPKAPWLSLGAAWLLPSTLSMTIGPFFFPWWVGIFAFMMMVSFWLFVIPQLGKVSALYGIPRPEYYSGETDLRGTARKIVSLPPVDRKEFPSDIFEIMKNPDLDKNQRRELNDASLKTLNLIAARNREKTALIARSRQPDIQSALDYLAANREGLEIERKTMQELG